MTPQELFDAPIDPNLSARAIEISCNRARRYIRSGKPFVAAAAHVQKAVALFFKVCPDEAQKLAWEVTESKKNATNN